MNGEKGQFGGKDTEESRGGTFAYYKCQGGLRECVWASRGDGMRLYTYFMVDSHDLHLAPSTINLNCVFELDPPRMLYEIESIY